MVAYSLRTIDKESKYIPLEKIIELHQKGLNQVEIAKFFGCSRQAINQRVKPYKDDIEGLDTFKSIKADLLAFHERRILNRLTNEDIQKSTGYQKVCMFSLLYDKERLERGETTQNIGYADYTKALSGVIEKRRQLETELGLDSEAITVSPEDEQGDGEVSG